MWLYVWEDTTDTFSQPDSIPGCGHVPLRRGQRNQGCSAFLFLQLQRLLIQTFLWGLLAHRHRVHIPQETRAFGLSPRTMNEDACGRGASWLPEGGPVLVDLQPASGPHLRRPCGGCVPRVWACWRQRHRAQLSPKVAVQNPGPVTSGSWSRGLGEFLIVLLWWYLL